MFVFYARGLFGQLNYRHRPKGFNDHRSYFPELIINRTGYANWLINVRIKWRRSGHWTTYCEKWKNLIFCCPPSLHVQGVSQNLWEMDVLMKSLVRPSLLHSLIGNLFRIIIVRRINKYQFILEKFSQMKQWKSISREKKDWNENVLPFVLPCCQF